MNVKARFLLLVMLLLTACSSAAAQGQATVNPTTTPVVAVTAPTASATATMAATAAPSATVTTAAPTATSTATGTATSAAAASATAGTPQATFTPFPSASPTAELQPTQVVKAAPTITPGGPPTPTPQPGKSLLDQYLPRRAKVGETQHFIFYAQDNYFPVDKTWWMTQAEVVYSYVSQRLDNTQVKHKISVAFQPPNKEACPIRGLAAESGSPMVIIFADQNSSQTYLLAVLSHEVGHAISYDGFAEGLPGNIALAEGLASWGSGKYWAAWFQTPSIDDIVRGYLMNGTFEDIAQNTDLHGVYPWQKNTGSSQNCLERRDRIYTEWASFTGYLIDTYGWPKAHQLYRRPAPIQQNGQTIELPVDYQGVYGKALNQLEWEWLSKISEK